MRHNSFREDYAIRVSDKFKMPVPVMRILAKLGEDGLGFHDRQYLNGSEGSQAAQAATRAAVCALDDILALSIQNSK